MTRIDQLLAYDLAQKELKGKKTMTITEQQVALLKKFGVEAFIRGWGEPKLDIRNGYIGKGVSLTTEDNEFKLSLTGGWFNLAEIQEHYQALQKGMATLEALSDIS